MIILDTNVLSALMQQQPDAQAAAWLDRQPAQLVWITSITLFEARYGLKPAMVWRCWQRASAKETCSGDSRRCCRTIWKTA